MYEKLKELIKKISELRKENVDSFGMGARNDHCHGPCTITFPRFQCIERQIFYYSLFHFYYKKKQKIVLGNSF